jgi:hypothetical protein
MSNKQSQEKLGKQTLTFTPFEDVIHIVGICDIEIGGRQGIGALILKRKESIQVKFAFDCQGIHPNLTTGQIVPIFEGIEGGLKEIPEREFLTIHFGSFTQDHQRQKELKELEQECQVEPIKLLLRSERLRVRGLTAGGLRKNKFMRLWCTYTVEDDEKLEDFAEIGLKKIQKIWHQFTGEIHQLSNTRLETIIRNSFLEGFQSWEQVISNKMGLSVSPLSAEEMWGSVWHIFNKSEPTEIPNPLKLNDNKVSETQTSDFHIRHHILGDENSVPLFDRKWVKIQNKYVGALNFSHKPGGWVDEYSQMRYLWSVFSKDKIFDTEVLCQVSKASQAIAKTNLQRLTKQSITSTSMSSDKGNIDVKAGLNIEESVEAQRTLYKGSNVLNTAVVFLVHRDSPQKLDEDCRYFASCFLRPAIVEREVEYAWKVWLQCCPFVWEALLTKPFNRRLPYFSSEAPGLTPLIRTATGDKSGFELIAEEGGTPVHLDLYKSHKNMAIFGTTRSGKSVLAAGILTPAIAQNIPVIALDFPKPDGTSTFTDYAKLLGVEGAYFDIAKEYNNLFELPDLRSMSAAVIKERMSDFKDFLRSLLMTMIIGTNSIGVSFSLVSIIESIIALGLQTFFSDDEIKLRYQLAFKAGVGTKEWEDTPTLNDFCKYCSPGYINLDSLSTSSTEVTEALGQIQIRLKYWLSSKVGQSISRPTSFRGDAKLLVFALRNLSSESDAAILALSAYAAALRRALASKASIFFLDEAPILFEFDAIADLIGRLCANGAKAGIRVILSAQEPESIFRSKAAAKIFANISTRLIGRIQSSAIDPFVDRFKYPYEIISRNSTEAFYPKKEGVYSNWLLDDNGKLTFCRYYPAHCLLAAVANNPDEQALRTLFLEKYKDNLILAMYKFSQDYIRLLRGEALSQEAKQLIANINITQVV